MDTQQSSFSPRLRPWQMVAVQALLTAAGFGLILGLMQLLPQDWPALVKMIVVMVPGMIPVIWVMIKLTKWAAPAARPNPDPRRTMLWNRGLLGGYFLFLALNLGSWISDPVFMMVLYTFCAVMFCRRAREMADDKVNTRVAADERDAELEQRAVKFADDAMLLAVLSLVVIDQFEWMDLTVTASVLFVLIVRLAGREFGFLWAEWRS
ncbi:MAG: hypothetical protein AAF674_19430 [Pseudomonadota bacterium]